MRKAFRAAKLPLHLYFKSGKVILPLLGLLAFLLVFYHVRPFHVVGSYSISFAFAFAVSLWFGVSLVWSEEPYLAQILSVKVGMVKLPVAQNLLACAFAAMAGLLLVVMPALGSIWIPDFFTRALNASDVLSAGFLHISATICGCSLGMLFHPRLIRDRKFAFISCLLFGLFSYVSGGLGVPFEVRLLLPPLYDGLYQTGSADAFSASYVIIYTLRFLLYGLACDALQVYVLNRRKF
ncbi:MAG: hypothetical protein LLF96_06445 [Eubacteriales bacterium]|nr:hypothetical protein [Eubacteriales bacterium]